MQSEITLENKALKLALFDFCETLANFQTADVFVDYIREQKHSLHMEIHEALYRSLNRLKVFLLINKFTSVAASGKKFKLYQLKGLNKDYLQKMARLYYEERIKPNLIPPLINEMLQLQRKGYKVAVVSAGYSIYLEYFAEDFNIEHIIATEIAFDKNKKCKGIISGKDCVGDEKVRRIDNYFHDQKIDFAQSISFSDSISDLPMLKLTGKASLVSRSGEKTIADIHNFNIIIWD